MHTLNVSNPMKVSYIKCRLKHYLSTNMVICRCHMFEFSVSKDMKKQQGDKRRVPTYLAICFLTLIVKRLRISVEHGRMVTPLNLIKHEISYFV